jgi:hypothetical protein
LLSGDLDSRLQALEREQQINSLLERIKARRRIGA